MVGILVAHHPVIKYGLHENKLFIDDFPIETSIYRGFPIATFDTEG